MFGLTGVACLIADVTAVQLYVLVTDLLTEKDQ